MVSIYISIRKPLRPYVNDNLHLMSVIILCFFFSYFQKGSSIIQPIELHPNDPSLAYPARISVDVEWTEALTSRYVLV